MLDLVSSARGVVLILLLAGWLTAGLNLLAESESWAEDLARVVNRLAALFGFLLWLAFLLVPTR